MRLIDEEFLCHPFFGSRRMTVWLKDQGYLVNRKRVQRLMQNMALEAFYPKRRTTYPDKDKEKYPYLLRNKVIDKTNQVWGSDITYIPVSNGYLYLVAVVDWYSRYVLAWKLSGSLESNFCTETLENALKKGKPEIFNTDQGCQYTCHAFTDILKSQKIQISMDGKGRALDNIYVERLWRSLKYEEVYLKCYDSAEQANEALSQYLIFFNDVRRHQALENLTPREVFYGLKNLQSSAIKMK
jgi:putative transposase